MGKKINFKPLKVSPYDAPSNSWINSTTNPKVKTTKGQGVGARSLVRNTSKVEGHDGVLRWRLG